MGGTDMSISAFSRRSLLSVKALRLYDEMGLLQPNRIDPSSGYRYYSETQLESARLISLLRKLDVPLAEIAVMVGQNSQAASQSLATWWEREEEQWHARRDLLRFIRSSVLGDAAERDRSEAAYEISVREMPEVTYLFHRANVHGPEVASFIGESVDMLRERAGAFNEPIGKHTVIYHGIVDFDSDGPAEVCLPIHRNSVAERDGRIRTEAPHQQAFTVLKKHQVAFPQILQVYHAVRRWIVENDYAISGPPREIYLGNFETAAHDDLICEVAIPIRTSKGLVI